MRVIRHRLLAAAVALALPMSAVGTAQAEAPDQAAGQAPIVRTDHGMVRGSTAGGVDKFLGVPFAAPPLGERRFAAPAPAARWDGVRQATSYGPACAQLPSGNGPWSDAEDCLYANVFRPAGARGRLPVLFFIYGGGLQNGGAQQYDGAKLAAENHMVVVTANYRLNVFGLLALAKSGGGSGLGGDYSLLDQQAALRWTRANASAFGGDPRAVTIGGESAGAMSVCAHLAAPGSAGLFRAAIMQSGSCVTSPLAQAEPAGADFARSVGCTDPAAMVACLRAKPATELLDASANTQFGLVSGGGPLPTAPADAVATGRIQRVPMIFGANHDEGRTFALGFGDNTPASYRDFVTDTFGARAPEVFKRYPLSDFSGPYAPTYAIAAILTDSGQIADIGGCPTLTLARRFSAATRVHMYQFDDRHFPGLTPGTPPGYDWGAPHAGELAYLFPSFDNGTPITPYFTAAQRRLADDMSHYWGSFVRRTTPDTRSPRLARWPALPSGTMLSLRPGGRSTPISLSEYRAQHKCDFWDALPLAHPRKAVANALF